MVRKFSILMYSSNNLCIFVCVSEVNLCQAARKIFGGYISDEVHTSFYPVIPPYKLNTETKGIFLFIEFLQEQRDMREIASGISYLRLLIPLNLMET